MEITIGLLAYLLALHETGSHLLAGVALSVGFIALFLAHSELFTEGFFYPIMAIVDGRGTWLELLRLWGVTLATNLLGGWVTVGLIALAFPQLHPDLAETAHHFLEILAFAREARIRRAAQRDVGAGGCAGVGGRGVGRGLGGYIGALGAARRTLAGRLDGRGGRLLRGGHLSGHLLRGGLLGSCRCGSVSGHLDVGCLGLHGGGRLVPIHRDAHDLGAGAGKRGHLADG